LVSAVVITVSIYEKKPDAEKTISTTAKKAKMLKTN
jgi:hypothetical protein